VFPGRSLTNPTGYAHDPAPSVVVHRGAESHRHRRGLWHQAVVLSRSASLGGGSWVNPVLLYGRTMEEDLGTPISRTVDSVLVIMWWDGGDEDGKEKRSGGEGRGRGYIVFLSGSLVFTYIYICMDVYCIYICNT
jgi:hypothetical protein